MDRFSNDRSQLLIKNMRWQIGATFLHYDYFFFRIVLFIYSTNYKLNKFFVFFKLFIWDHVRLELKN